MLYLEGELEVLAAPDVEAAVVGAESLEERLVDAEEAPRHGGAVHGLGRVRVSLLLALRHCMPVKLLTEDGNYSLNQGQNNIKSV